MVERFFSTNFPNLHDDSMMLLSGPPSSGKTSLLFQFAFNSVVDTLDKSAIFICSRRRLDAKPPFLSRGIDPSSHVFDRIHMKYVEDEEGINKFFAAFHMHHKFPVSVVVDDLVDFFDESETGPCMLVFSDTHHGDTPRLLHIYKRWTSSIYTIKGNGVGSFIVKSSRWAATKTAKYSITLQYLVLEEIHENEEQRDQM